MKTFFKVLFGLLIFSMNLSGAYGAIEGNTDINTAHHFGHWQNKRGTLFMKKDQKEAYFSFNINHDEKIMIMANYEENGLSIELLETNEISSRPVKPNYLEFIYVRADGINKNRHFFRIIRANSQNGDLYIPISFENRISSKSETFNFNGIASNKGNKGYNGTLSNEISLDLRHNNSIPDRSIVTSVSTNSNMNPYQGNVTHKIGVNFAWHSSLVNNANSGMYSINERDNIEVKNVWRF